MKTAVTLRTGPAPAALQVCFPYYDAALRAALLAAGVYYNATARHYAVPADHVVIAGLRAVCEQRGIALHARTARAGDRAPRA